jgi:hypothetical protein
MATAAPRMIRMGPDGSAATPCHTVIFVRIPHMFDKSLECRKRDNFWHVYGYRCTGEWRA